MSLFLVDGYNLMHRFAFSRVAGRSLEEKRALLEGELRRFLAASPSGTRVVIVYDGIRGLPSQTERRGGLEIRFSRPPQNADSLLLEYCRRLGQSSEACVVTSDLSDIAGRLEGLPLKRMSSERFVALLATKKRGAADADEKPGPVSRAEARSWAQMFGFDRGPDKKP